MAKTKTPIVVGFTPSALVVYPDVFEFAQKDGKCTGKYKCTFLFDPEEDKAWITKVRRLALRSHVSTSTVLI